MKTYDIPIETEQVPINGNDGNNKNEEKPSITSNPPIKNVSSLVICILLVWLFSAVILFVRKNSIYQGFTRYIKAGQKPIDDIDILNRFGILLIERGIKKQRN